MIPAVDGEKWPKTKWLVTFLVRLFFIAFGNHLPDDPRSAAASSIGGLVGAAGLGLFDSVIGFVLAHLI